MSAVIHESPWNDLYWRHMIGNDAVIVCDQLIRQIFLFLLLLRRFNQFTDPLHCKQCLEIV